MKTQLLWPHGSEDPAELYAVMAAAELMRWIPAGGSGTRCQSMRDLVAIRLHLARDDVFRQRV
jgi:hypothetical protein